MKAVMIQGRGACNYRTQDSNAWKSCQMHLAEGCLTTLLAIFLPTIGQDQGAVIVNQRFASPSKYYAL